MKALAIKQPWASLIVGGIKKIENRTWVTRFRGPVLIHASKLRDAREMRAYINLCESRGIERGKIGMRWEDAPVGGIIGMADIVDCVTESDDPFFCGPFGFVLENARPLPFLAMRGALGFFEATHPEEK